MVKLDARGENADRRTAWPAAIGRAGFVLGQAARDNGMFSA